MTQFTEQWLAERLAKQGKVEPKSKPAPAKKTKYGNRKVTVDNIVFDSQKEATRYKELKLMEAAGAITNLQLQKVFVLAPSVVLNGRKKPEVKYLCDFYYWRGRDEVVEDVKSAATRKLPVYRLKAHFMRYLFKIDIIEI